MLLHFFKSVFTCSRKISHYIILDSKYCADFQSCRHHLHSIRQQSITTEHNLRKFPTLYNPCKKLYRPTKAPCVHKMLLVYYKLFLAPPISNASSQFFISVQEKTVQIHMIIALYYKQLWSHKEEGPGLLYALFSGPYVVVAPICAKQSPR